MRDKLRLLAEQTGNLELGTFSLDDLTEITVEEGLDNVLVYLQNNNIYILDGERSVEIAKRSNPAWGSLCLHEDKLYYSGEDGGADGIYETLTGKKIAERDNMICTLFSHNGTLYDAGDYGGIYETLTGENIAERDDLIWSLVSHKGVLYDARDYGESEGAIYETLTGKRIAERKGSWVWSLVSHEGTMYDAGDGGIFETLTGKRIAERRSSWVSWVNSLVSHEGTMYDAGRDGIFETLTGDRIVKGNINSMTSVPRKIFEEEGILK
jgi:hypothetical protein